jgi:hypothetical protein
MAGGVVSSLWLFELGLELLLFHPGADLGGVDESVDAGAPFKYTRLVNTTEVCSGMEKQ